MLVAQDKLRTQSGERVNASLHSVLFALHPRPIGSNGWKQGVIAEVIRALGVPALLAMPIQDGIIGPTSAANRARALLLDAD